MITRVLEPELMDTAEDADEYDRIDHRTVNDRFVADLRDTVRLRSAAAAMRDAVVLDIGAGTARIPIALCTAWNDCTVVAVDMAGHMLRIAVANVRRAAFAHRILCPRASARQLPFADGRFPFVVSNSLIHHIPDPAPVLTEMCRVAAPGAGIFVRDLFRPETTGDVERLVATHAAYETRAQRELFAASLRAALTVEEVRGLVASLPLTEAAVVASSDRHWTLTATRR